MFDAQGYSTQKGNRYFNGEARFEQDLGPLPDQLDSTFTMYEDYWHIQRSKQSLLP